jgi:hypothetical protein
MMTKTLLSAFTLFLFATSVHAQETGPNIVGKYGTVIVQDGKPQPVSFDVKSLMPGAKDALTMSYAPPLDCKFTASYGGFVEDAHFFYVTSPSFCKPVFKKATVKLSNNGDGKILYEVQNQKNEFIESGLLDKK